MDGCVPGGFKTPVVTPLMKNSTLQADDLNNYCPVSCLSFISKLFERVVSQQLLEHIHGHKTIHINQHIKQVTRLR